MRPILINLLIALSLPLAPLTAAPLGDAAAQRISDLEAKLAQEIPTSDESARTALDLIPLYKKHGQVFGLIRITSQFATNHLGHPEHQQVLLTGIDALKATSRHPHLQAACRQFIERYPDSRPAAAVWRSLAESLAAQSPESRLPIAEAYTNAWRLSRADTSTTHDDAIKAIQFHTEHNSTESHATAAGIAKEVIASMGSRREAAAVAYQGFNSARRANEFALASQLGNALLKLPNDLNQNRLAGFHSDLAETYLKLDQPTNAVAEFQKSLKIKESPEAIHGLIRAFIAAKRPRSEISSAAEQLSRNHPDYRYLEEIQHTRARSLADTGKYSEAASVIEETFTKTRVSRSVLDDYLRWLDAAKSTPSRAQKALQSAAASLPDQIAWENRWTLAFGVFRDRLQDNKKAAATVRSMLFDHPVDDAALSDALSWLLDEGGSPEADIGRYIETARSNQHLSSYRGLIERWIKSSENDKEKRTLARQAQSQWKSYLEEHVTKLWRSAADRNAERAIAARTELLGRPDLTKKQRIDLLSQQAYTFRHDVGDKDRPQSVSLYSTLVALDPTNYEAARSFVEAASNYGSAEQKRESAERLLGFKTGEKSDGLVFSRLTSIAASLEDRSLASRVLSWIDSTEQQHGLATDYLSDTGSYLATAGLADGAARFWQSHIAADPDSWESQRCVSKLLEQIPEAENLRRIALINQALERPTNNHGAYSAWLADIRLKNGKIDEFIATLNRARERQDSRPFSDWGLGDHLPQEWIGYASDTSNTLPLEHRVGILSAIQRLQNGRSSAAASLALLDLSPQLVPDALDRLVRCYDATRTAGRHYTSWDSLKPYAQRRMADGRFAEAAALYSGLINNVGSVGAETVDAARSAVRLAYTNLGSLGLEIDPSSPVAPLMEIGLHLRLDDQEAALDTYRQNLAAFDSHRDEVPVEILKFAAEAHIEEGTEESQARAEEILRSWLIKFAEDEKVQASDKAKVQLLLARLYHSSQRYDVARAEFTTVVNLFPDSPEALEARFGIGETFLDQKVYEEAETAFAGLSNNPLPRIRIRADFLRGVLALKRDDRSTAREIFRSVLQSMPDLELADRTLFQLAEVYGLEKRYLDQLQLLRTVGRLGRESKLWHVPGRALSIVVQDTDLGISRGSSRVPVVVTASPGGDSESTFLTSGGAGKGLFLGEIDTSLGATIPNNGILEVLGGDILSVSYPEEFAAEFGDVQLGKSEIRIASDGVFAMASSWIEDPTSDDSPGPAQTDEERRIAELLQTDRRPPDQIKPGNVIYFRVADPDRSLTADVDRVPVKVVASSGDEVQVELVETGAVTGVFRGDITSADLPAGATASDTSIGHSPLMAIDSNIGTSWRSEPDGQTPKHLEVDMKDLYTVETLTFSSPSAETQFPVRFDVLGSHDGRYFYRLAQFPVPETEEKPAGGFGRMSRRVFTIDNPNLNAWQNFLELASKNDVPAESTSSLTWPEFQETPRPDDLKGPRLILWQGLFNQSRDGAVRFELSGHRVALMIDGDLILPPTPEEASVDAYLTTGSHELSVFMTLSDCQSETALVRRARENPNTPLVRLGSFTAEDFPDPGTVQPSPPSPPSTVSTAEASWRINLPKRELRHLRIDFHEFMGEAVAINSLSVSGGGATPIPPETDLLALADNDVIEIAPGDTITGTYIDQFTANGIGRNRPLSQTMTATYHNGKVLAVSNDFHRAPNGSVLELRKEVLRIDAGERVTIEVTDYDLDRTGQADTITVGASIEGNDRASLTLNATETGSSTGVFRAEFDTAPSDISSVPPDTLPVSPGDRIYLHYDDVENTFPGHRARRETPIFVRVPTDGDIRIVETQLVYPPQPIDPLATPPPPEPRYLLPRPAAAPTSPKAVAYGLPLTFTVIDPDAARDTRSTVAVDLSVEGREPVRVLCEISQSFSPDNPDSADLTNPALHEGRFVGQVLLQLGTRNSPPSIPVSDSSSIPALIGSVVPPGSNETPIPSSDPLIPVLNVTGKDTIRATYVDMSRSASADRTHLHDFAQLASDARLMITTPTGDEPAEILHVGERLFLSISDPDLDLSDARDATSVTITTTNGEREILPLEETLAHSGVFTSSFPLKSVQPPLPDNFDPASPAIDAFFGSQLSASYTDLRPPGGGEPKPHEISIPIAVGTDGIATAFSKIFSDEDLAIQTQFHVAESYFELFKSHRKLGRDDDASVDLESGRRTLRELQDDYPNPKYAPRVAYLLGQFAQELGDWDDAIDQYESVVRDYPDHTLAPDAQYKLGQCYEESQRFDEALDAYVGLAATYPESPLIASVMIRIIDRFYKEEEFLAAAGVGEKFLLRFDAHQWAPRIAFRVGQCYYKAHDYGAGGGAFDSFIKKYPDDELAAQSLFWAGESYRMANNVPEAFRRYNRCRWDYPETDAAKYSRGRLALPEMLAQFEREAQLDDAN